jgi:hypothetical protein
VDVLHHFISGICGVPADNFRMHISWWWHQGSYNGSPLALEPISRPAAPDGPWFPWIQNWQPFRPVWPHTCLHFGVLMRLHRHAIRRGAWVRRHHHRIQF